jgi:hypothetical protein
VLRKILSGEIEHARWHSKKAQLLKVALEAERAIARLEGLYEGPAIEAATTLHVVIEKREPGRVTVVEEVAALPAPADEP